MSRAYRISVSETLCREITAADEVISRLELLAILPPDETATLLRTELLARGFQASDDGTLTRHDGNSLVSVDPCTGEVTVKVAATQQSNLERSAEAISYDDVGPGLDQAQAKVQAELRKQLEARHDALTQAVQRETTRELEAKLVELQPELAKVVNKITREALKIKAAQLGNITGVLEDEASGELTLTVEV